MKLEQELKLSNQKLFLTINNCYFSMANTPFMIGIREK